MAGADEVRKTVWNTKPGMSSFEHVRVPADAAELAARVAEAVRDEVDERVRAYETPVTTETLRTPAK